MKYIVILLIALLLVGCSMTKAARNEVKEQMLQDVGNPDCWIGFNVALQVGETENLSDKALREAMQDTVVLPNADYSRCYKWGLIYKAQGEKVLEVIKRGIQTGIALAK